MDNTKRKSNAELYKLYKQNQSKKNGKDDSSKRLSNRDLYFKRKDMAFGESIPSRLESLTKQGSEVYNSYKSRFFDDKGEYVHNYRGDTEDAYNSYSQFKTKYDSESKEILDHLDKYGDQYDAKTVKEIRDILTSNSKTYDDMLNAYKEDNEYWSKWDTEDAYNADVEALKVYEGKTVADLPALSKEIEELKVKKDEYTKIKLKRDDQYSTMLSGYLRAGYKKEDAEAMALKSVKKFDDQLAQYGDIGKTLTDKTAYYNTASRIQNGIKLSSVSNPESANYDADFEKKAAAGEKKGLETHGAFVGTNGATAVVGSDVNNNIIAYRNNRNEEGVPIAAMQGAMSAGGGLDREEKFAWHMSDEEFKNYCYYYSISEDKANEYLDSIEETVNQRQAEDRFGMLKENTFLEVLFGVEAGLDQFASGVKSLFNGDDYIPTSSTQMLSGMVRKDLSDDGFNILGSSLGQIAYDAVTTTSNMMPSILLSYATGGIGGAVGMSAKAAGVASKLVGAASMGASASGNAYQQMLNLGYDKGQARSYATLVGLSEAGLEYLIGGISKLGGKMSGNVIKKTVSAVDNAFARTAIKLGGSMFWEGFEESIQEVLNPYFENLVLYANNDMSDIDWQQVAYSGLLGALSAGMLEGGTIISGEVNTYKAGKQVKEAGQTSNLVKLGKSFSADTVAYQIADKVNENTGAYTIGRLLHEVGADGLSAANMSDITKSLERKHIAPQHAKTIAKWLNKAVEGGYFTKSQIKALDTNEDITKTFKDVIINQNSTVNQRMQSYNDILQNVANEVTAQAQAKAKTNNEAQKVDTPTPDTTGFAMLSNEEVKKRVAQDPQFAIEYAKWASSVTTEGKPTTESKQPLSNRFDVSNDGKTINTTTGEAVNVAGVYSVTDGKMKLKLDNGEVVDADEVEFASDDEGLLYSAVLDMGLSVGAANSVVLNYDPTSGMSVSDYVHGIREAYEYGSIGVPLKSVSKFQFASKLSEKQRADAHSFGKIHRNEKRIEQMKDESASSPAKSHAISGEGKVTFDGDKLKLDGRRRESLNHIEAIAKVTGVNFHIFESYVDKSGKRVFKDKNGEIKEAPNGIFYEKDSSIWIDLNAGNEGEGLMLYTVAHELTHFIRKWSPAKFDALADFLMEQYANNENISIQELINEQIKKAKDDNREIDFGEAYEEFVADSMEKMLTDGRVLKKLYAKDKGLFNKLKSWIDKMASRISKYYDGVNPDSREGKFVAGLNDEFKKIQDLFADALSDASTNYKAGGEDVSSIGAIDLNEVADAETTDGKKLFQYRAMKADKDIYRDMLKTANIMTDAEINNLFDTIDAAMDIIVDNLEVLDFAWDADIDDRAFNPVKPNSDSLYQVSVDFSTLCRKRLLQQAIQVHLQEALNKPLTREEGIAIRDALMAIQEEGRQIEIACALCYVESARMKSPAQIKKFLNNRESVIKDFFASKSDAVKAEMKKAEMDAREKLGVGNKPLKSLPGKTAKAIRDAKKAVKANYTPTAKEQAIIDASKEMSVTDFTSPEGLEDLAKNHKDLFDAYTSYIRNATKSKGIEADTWWRAGDSAGIGDTLIANMNAENGLRSQSWSDFQVIHLLDYIAATIELSTRKAKMQAYSKVADYVELMGNTGQMINISLIPGREFSGSLSYDSTEGMEYKRALELRNKYHATAGTICIGINNTQIQMLLADGNIDYVIPYHRSGMAKTIRKAMHIPTWDEYENYQSESELDRKSAIKQAEKYGVKLLDENDPNYHKHSSFSEWFDVEVAKQIAKMENAAPSNKAMQKKYGVMYGGYMAMQNAADTYLKLCAERGVAPKFSNENANFTEEDNYWKLLIDRKMVDNVTGEIIEQQSVKPVFDQAEILRILNDELERYPGVKEDQEYATRKVVQGFLSGNIKGGMSSQAIANAMKTPVDNVTKTNILASSQADDGKLSGRKKTDSSSLDKVVYNGNNNEKGRATRGEQREETRKDFYRRVDEEKFEVKQRGKTAFAFTRPDVLSTKAQETERELTRLGVPCVVVDRLEVNKDGVTTKSNAEASTARGDAVYVNNSTNENPKELAGHEAFHFWDGDESRDIFKEVLVDKIDFPSDSFKVFERKIQEDYFDGEIDAKSDEWVEETEEVFAHIGGLIHAGDLDNVVHQFVRDFDAVKSAWDDLVKSKTADGIRYSGRNKEQQDYVEVASKAVMTTDRIDYLIEDSGAGSRVDYANYWITSISPTDFLNMTLTLSKQDRSAFDKFPSEWNENSNMDTYDYMGELKKNMRQTPYLAIDITTGEVVGHEGRHRMRALERNGIESAEIRVEFRDEDGMVVKYSTDGKRLQVKDAVKITNQFGTGQTASIKNVIPLNKDYRDTILANYGEATSTSNMDIRYSSRNKEAVENYEKVNELLVKENEQLREDVKALKELVRLQNKVTHGKMMKESSLNLITKRLMRYAHAEGDVSELTSYLKDVYSYILEGKDVSWEGITEKAQPAVDWLRDNEKKTKHREEYADEVLSHLRTLRVTLNEQQKQEVAHIYGSYNTYRQKSMGKIFFVNEGVSLDSMWQELCELYPHYFDSDVNSNDQPIVLMDIFNELQNSYVEDYYYEDEMVDQDLLTKIYEGFWELDTVYTVADKNQREISTIKNRHKEQMDKLRESHAEKDAKFREERRAKIEEVRSTYRDRLRATEQKYRDARAKATEGRNKTVLRNKIKRVVGDLNKLLYRGTKERNTKEGLKDTVESALVAAEFLFVNNITNDEIVRSGVEVATEAESKLLNEYMDLLEKRDGYIGKIEALGNVMVNDAELYKQVDDNYKMIDYIDRKLYALNKQLSGVFERERIRLNKATVSYALDALAKAYKAIETSDQPAVAGVYDEYMYSRLVALNNDVGGALIKDMSMPQLQEVYDAFTMVLNTVRNANVLFDQQIKATIQQQAQSVSSELYHVGGAKEKVAVIKDFVQRNGWNTLKPVYAFRMLGSKTLERLYNNIRKGEDTWYVDVSEAKSFRQKLNKKYGFSSWDFDKAYTFKAKSGKNFTLSLEQIMSIYAYSRREQALAHLIEGGIVFDSDIEVTEKVKGVPVKYKVNTADAHSISAETIAEIVGNLTKEQRGYVEEMQAYLSDVMGEKGNEVSLAMYGVRLYKEKHYFPLKSSQYYMNFKPDDAGEFKIKNSGFSKETKQHANNPVVLGDFTSVWGNHVNDMSMYHAFVLPLEDFNRVFNYKTPSSELTVTKSVKATLQNAFGSGAESYIRTLLRDLNGGVRSQNGVEIINKMTALAKKGATFLSASVTIQQPTAIARAMAYIPAKYLVPATKNAYNFKNHNKDWEEVKAYAPIAGIKEMGYFDTGMGQSSVDWITSEEYEGFREKFHAFFTDSDFRDEVLSKAPSMADEIGWVQIWHAVKREIADTTDLKAGSEEFLKRCGERFTEVVTLTQVYDSVFSRSGLMRSKDTGVKMATAFMAEPTTMMNMAVDAIVQGKRIGGKAGFKLASGVFTAIAVSCVLNALAKALVTAGRDDDEDETWFEKYISDATGGIVDSFNPLTYIPFVKDIWSIFQGYDVSRMDMSIISDLQEAIENLYKDNKSTYTKVSGVITSIAALFGIPAKNLERDIRGAVNTVKTMTNGVEGSSYGIVEALKEGITGEETSKMQRAENASNRGDTATVKKIVSDLVADKIKSGKTEKEAKSAVRASFTSMYKKLYVEAFKKKDSNEMNRIRKLLYAAGVYGTLSELDKTLLKWRTEE